MFKLFLKPVSDGKYHSIVTSGHAKLSISHVPIISLTQAFWGIPRAKETKSEKGKE